MSENGIKDLLVKIPFLRLLLITGMSLLSISVADGVDWKLYARKALLEPGVQGNAYYDKDSIAYPYKRFLGTIEDKAIVSVWVKYIFSQDYREMKLLCHVLCQQKQIIPKSIVDDGKYIYPESLDHPYGIEPDSTDEKLYRIVCKQ